MCGSVPWMTSWMVFALAFGLTVFVMFPVWVPELLYLFKKHNERQRSQLLRAIDPDRILSVRSPDRILAAADPDRSFVAHRCTQSGCFDLYRNGARCLEEGLKCQKTK